MNRDYLSPEEQKKLRSNIITATVAGAILTLGLYAACNKKPAETTHEKPNKIVTAQPLEKRLVQESKEFKTDVNNHTYSLSQSIDSVMSRIRKFKPTFERAAPVLNRSYGLNLSWTDYASLPGAETSFRNYDMTPPDVGYAQMTREHYERFVKPDIKQSKTLRKLFGNKVPIWQEIASNPYFNVTASAVSLAKLSRFFKHQNYDVNFPPKDAGVAAYNAGPGRIHFALKESDSIKEAIDNIQDAKRVDIGNRNDVPTAYEDMYRARAFANVLRAKFRQNKPGSSSLFAKKSQASHYSQRKS